MEKKFSVADFAEIVGTTAKTIYQKIDNYENLPVNEQLKTVKEKVKGREITFIITSEEQLQIYKNLYRKNIVTDCEYYENVTINNGEIPVKNFQNTVNNNDNNNSGTDIFDKLLTLNETYLNRIETVNNELMEYKSKQLLLEDKAGRESLYLKEINELKTDNEKLKTRNKMLFTVLTVIITVLITVTITVLLVNNAVNKSEDNSISNPTESAESMLIKKMPAKK